MTLRQFFHALLWSFRHLTGQLDIAETSAIRRFIQPGDVCIDIGAHGGSWTKVLSRLVCQQGHVYAFEALPYYAQILRATAAIIRLSNVTVINSAVTNHKGPVPIIWRDATSGERLTGLTHIAGEDEDARDAIVVAGSTLDAFIDSQHILSRVSFVKADVEGSELMVVQGAERTIARFRPVFYLEVISEYCLRYGYQPAALFDIFDTLEYTANAITGDEIVSIDSEADSGSADMLFVPTERLHRLDS